VSAETDESPLLEAVTGKQIVKVLQAGKASVYCSDLYSVEINDGAVITHSHESCVEVVKKFNLQFKLGLWLLIHVELLSLSKSLYEIVFLSNL
jgi:hypothetical protein